MLFTSVKVKRIGLVSFFCLFLQVFIAKSEESLGLKKTISEALLTTEAQVAGLFHYEFEMSGDDFTGKHPGARWSRTVTHTVSHSKNMEKLHHTTLLMKEGEIPEVTFDRAILFTGEVTAWLKDWKFRNRQHAALRYKLTIYKGRNDYALSNRPTMMMRKLWYYGATRVADLILDKRWKFRVVNKTVVRDGYNCVHLAGNVRGLTVQYWLAPEMDYHIIVRHTWRDDLVFEGEKIEHDVREQHTDFVEITEGVWFPRKIHFNSTPEGNCYKLKSIIVGSVPDGAFDLKIPADTYVDDNVLGRNYALVGGTASVVELLKEGKEESTLSPKSDPGELEQFLMRILNKAEEERKALP